MRNRIERSSTSLVQQPSAGFTLVEVMVWVSALTLLAVVISAPKAPTSDLRRAALTISRVHDIVVATELYRTYVGQWPKNHGCVILGAGEAGESLYDGYKVKPITGWGDDIEVECNNKNNDYEITYPVPKNWADMFIENLEETRFDYNDGDQKVLLTKVSAGGNLSNPIFFSNNTLSDDDGVADIDDIDHGCEIGEKQYVFYTPDAVCFNTPDDDSQGQVIRSELDLALNVVRMSRVLYKPPAGETPAQYSSQPANPKCDRKERRNGTTVPIRARVKALVQCKKD